MKRFRTFMTLVLPSMLAGGLVFGSAFGHAAGPDVVGFWPAAGDVAAGGAKRKGPPPPPAPAPPAPPDHWAVPPMPPMPPPPAPAPAPVVRASGGGSGGKIRVVVRDGKVTVEGITEVVRGQLDAVREALGANPHITRDVRDKVNGRLDKVRAIIERRMARVHGRDMDALGRELEQMGDELEGELEGLDEELEKLGKGLGKRIGKDIAKDIAKAFDPDKFELDMPGVKKRDRHDKKAAKKAPPAPHDDDGEDGEDHDSDGGSDDDGDPTPAPAAAVDFKGVTLTPAQRDKIVELRKSTETTIAAAQKDLRSATDTLEAALANPKSTERDISSAVDRVSGHEAVIRKARLLAWVKAKQVLDADQRKKIEGSLSVKAALKP